MKVKVNKAKTLVSKQINWFIRVEANKRGRGRERERPEGRRGGPVIGKYYETRSCQTAQRTKTRIKSSN